MANVELLKEKIEESGMTITFIARKCGMSRETLYNRMEKPDFKASEIISLTKVLGLSKQDRDKIFFNL